VSEYNTDPKTGVLPCHKLNVTAVIVFGSIGVLKVAEIILTVETLAGLVTPLDLDIVGIILTAAAIADSVALLILLRDTFVPPLPGDVRITVGAIQTFTIPGPSSLQPTIKMPRSKAVVSTAESETPRDLRIIREKCVHRFKAVDGFVDEVFMASSLIS
jgi:hypothetical protein